MTDPIFLDFVYERPHFFWHPGIFFTQRFFEAACSFGTQWIDCNICLNTSNKWVQKLNGQYMNGSIFSKVRYMNGVGFEILARTPVPKLSPSSPPPAPPPTPPPPPPTSFSPTLLLPSVSFLVYSYMLRIRRPNYIRKHIRPGSAPLFYKFTRYFLYICIFLLQSRATKSVFSRYLKIVIMF